MALDFEQEGCLSFGCVFFPSAADATRRKADTTLDTHHLLVGISFRF